MFLKPTVVLYLIFASSNFGIAQREFERKEKRTVEGYPRFKIGVLNFNKQPGIRIGAEIPTSNEKNTWVKANGISNQNEKTTLIAANILAYRQPNLNNNYLLQGEWIKRTSLQNGFFWDYAPGGGYCRSYLDEVFYVRKKNESVKRDKTIVQNQVFISGSASFGQNIRLNGMDFKVYGKSNVFLFYPVYSKIMPKLGLEIGTIINFNQ